MMVQRSKSKEGADGPITSRSRIAIKPGDEFTLPELDKKAIFQSATAQLPAYYKILEETFAATKEIFNEETHQIKTRLTEVANVKRAEAQAHPNSGQAERLTRKINAAEAKYLSRLNYNQKFFPEKVAKELLKISALYDEDFSTLEDGAWEKVYTGVYESAKINTPSRSVDRQKQTPQISAANQKIKDIIRETLAPLQKLPAPTEYERIVLKEILQELSGTKLLHQNNQNPINTAHTALHGANSEPQIKQTCFNALDSKAQQQQAAFFEADFVNTAPKEAFESSLTYKRLFINELAAQAADAGTLLDPEAIYRKDAILDSQSLLRRHDFSQFSSRRFKNAGTAIGDSESSTPYQFTFGFNSVVISPPVISIAGAAPAPQESAPQKQAGQGAGNPAQAAEPSNLPIQAKQQLNDVTQPIFLVDDKALTTMEAAGISQSSIQRFFENFMKMAGMSEHDYIHGACDPYLNEMSHTFSDKENAYGGQDEDHALSSHAQVTAGLFERHPKRKEKVLAWAKEAFIMIEEFQQQMHSAATTKAEHEAADNIGTYLTEIYSHRLFRVISPRDADLEKPLKDGKSIIDRLEAITLVSPDYLESEIPQDASQMDRLLANCSVILSTGYNPDQPIYVDIHKPRTFEMEPAKGDGPAVEMSAMEVFGMCRDVHIAQGKSTLEQHEEIGKAHLEVDEKRETGGKPLASARQDLREVKGKWTNHVINQAAAQQATTLTV